MNTKNQHPTDQPQQPASSNFNHNHVPDSVNKSIRPAMFNSRVQNDPQHNIICTRVCTFRSTRERV